MPIKECSENKKPGWKYGNEGFCYVYEDDNPDTVEDNSMRAKKKAIKQALAITGGTFKEDGSVASKLYPFYQKLNYKK